MSDKSIKGRVVVDNSWQVTVPEGFVACTDNEIIGDHRNIVIMEDKKGNDFSEPFVASISFTSQVNENENAREMVNVFTGFLLNGEEHVVRNDQLYVSYSYEGTDHDGGDTLDRFHMIVAYGSRLCSIQVFFNNSSLSYEQQMALVKRVSGSVQLTSEDTGRENNELVGISSLTFHNNREAVVDDAFVVPVPSGYHFSTDVSVIGDERKLVMVPKNYALGQDPMRPEF